MSEIARRGGVAALLALLTLAAACSGGGSAPAAPAKPAAATSAPAAAPPTASAPTAASAAPAAPAQPAALQKVRYGELLLFSDAGVYISMEQGYFAEQGIDVETSTFDSAANMVAPLATN